jgi:predicted NUDIX family NTP pyrophosphohydrolase
MGCAVSKQRQDDMPAAKATPTSAGILLYHASPDGLQVLLAHPGGPYFTRKDIGAWTIPKGLINADESPADAARREFEEEVGWAPEGDLQSLGEVRLKSGKRVVAFAIEATSAPAEILARFSPGKFTMEWPRGSGRIAEFPEVDAIDFLPLKVAREKINPAQRPLLDRLLELRG